MEIEESLGAFAPIPMAELAGVEARYESGVVPRRGATVMVGGEGCTMIDSEGNRYLDLTSAQGVAMLGYGHPALTNAIAEQAARLHACPNFFHNDQRAAFLQALVSLSPAHLSHAFLANSGAEAIDGALKFARLHSGRSGIVAARQAFHGRTLGALSVTWEPRYRSRYEPLLPGVSHVPFGSVEALEDAINEETATLILEVIQGEGGVNLADDDYFASAQQLCRRSGALLIVDEIQTGFRTGRWFAHQHYGIEPDIMTLAKGLGGGFPMGAILFTESIQQSLFSGAHGTTFGGNPLACAAGLAALRTYSDEGLIERSAELGDWLIGRLKERLGATAAVKEIRGKGMMIGIDLRTRVVPILKRLMMEHGILALPAGATVLRLLPPLIIEKEELERAVEAIATVLEE